MKVRAIRKLYSKAQKKLHKSAPKQFHKSAQKKLLSDAGETLVETLVTMIILSLAVLMLTGAIVTSARVNFKADNTSTAFSTENQSDSEEKITITESGSAGNSITMPVEVHMTENGYTYYEYDD